jgi:hypothetical protein
VFRDEDSLAPIETVCNTRTTSERVTGAKIHLLARGLHQTVRNADWGDLIERPLNRQKLAAFEFDVQLSCFNYFLEPVRQSKPHG